MIFENYTHGKNQIPTIGDSTGGVHIGVVVQYTCTSNNYAHAGEICFHNDRCTTIMMLNSTLITSDMILTLAP